MVQNEKKSVCCTLYLRNHTSWFLCKIIISPGVFYIFSKSWFFGLLGVSKMAHNDKKLCPLLVISQEPYIIWSWSMVHKCKRIISLGVFYIFSKFFTKNYVCCTTYLSKHTSFFFFHFFKILIFQVFQSSSINPRRKFWGVPHLHMYVIFYK